MKLNYLFLFAVLTLVFAIVSGVSGQVRVGGYKTISATDKSVIEAAEFAITAQSKKDGTEYSLDSVLKAETQTVAGTNFRLCLDVLAPEAEDDSLFNQQVIVVVFRNLKKQYSLTSWTEADCSDQREESNNNVSELNL